MFLVGLSVLQAAKRIKLYRVLPLILISCSLAGVYWNYSLLKLKKYGWEKAAALFASIPGSREKRPRTGRRSLNL